MLVQIDETSVALTPFGSLIRAAPPVRRTSRARAWTERIRALFALLLR
jgi:hypothetical protein